MEDGFCAIAKQFYFRKCGARYRSFQDTYFPIPGPWPKGAKWFLLTGVDCTSLRFHFCEVIAHPQTVVYVGGMVLSFQTKYSLGPPVWDTTMDLWCRNAWCATKSLKHHIGQDHENVTTILGPHIQGFVNRCAWICLWIVHGKYAKCSCFNWNCFFLHIPFRFWTTPCHTSIGTGFLYLYHPWWKVCMAPASHARHIDTICGICFFLQTDHVLRFGLVCIVGGVSYHLTSKFGHFGRVCRCFFTGLALYFVCFVIHTTYILLLMEEILHHLTCTKPCK